MTAALPCPPEFSGNFLSPLNEDVPPPSYTADVPCSTYGLEHHLLVSVLADVAGHDPSLVELIGIDGDLGMTVKDARTLARALWAAGHGGARVTKPAGGVSRAPPRNTAPPESHCARSHLSRFDSCDLDWSAARGTASAGGGIHMPTKICTRSRIPGPGTSQVCAWTVFTLPVQASRRRIGAGSRLYAISPSFHTLTNS